MEDALPLDTFVERFQRCDPTDASAACDMTTPPELRLSDDTEAHRYEAHLEDELVGFLDYHSQPGLVTLLHTEVPREWEGRGVGTQLIQFAFDDIRDRGVKLLPICPFVIAYLRDHPEQRDLLRDR